MRGLISLTVIFFIALSGQARAERVFIECQAKTRTDKAQREFPGTTRFYVAYSTFIYKNSEINQVGEQKFKVSELNCDYRKLRVTDTSISFDCLLAGDNQAAEYLKKNGKRSC